MPTPVNTDETRPMRPPTQRQLVVLSMLDTWIKMYHGLSPSYRELAKWCDVKSVRTITEHVHSLMRKGLVASIPGETRTLQITDEGGRVLKTTPIKTISIRLG